MVSTLQHHARGPSASAAPSPLSCDKQTRRSIQERSYDSSPTDAGRITLIPHHLLFMKHGAPTNGVNMSAGF